MSVNYKLECRRLASRFIRFDTGKFKAAYDEVHGALYDFELLPKDTPTPEQMQRALADITETARYIMENPNFERSKIADKLGPLDDYTHTFRNGEYIHCKPLEQVKALGIVARALSLVESYGDYRDMKQGTTEAPMFSSPEEKISRLFSDPHVAVTTEAHSIVQTVRDLSAEVENTSMAWSL